jgi:hypothetical protein
VQVIWCDTVGPLTPALALVAAGVFQRRADST